MTRAVLLFFALGVAAARADHGDLQFAGEVQHDPGDPSKSEYVLKRLSEMIAVPEKAEGQEFILKIGYSVRCAHDEEGKFRGITGGIKIGDVIRRFELNEGKSQSELLIGPLTPDLGQASFILDESDHCSLGDLKLTLVPEDTALPKSGDPKKDALLASKLAMIHAPFVAVRPNQLHDWSKTKAGSPRTNDLPLLVAYSLTEPKRGGVATLRYTLFLSDEDSKKKVSETAGQMGRYGRYGDIEWVYEVELNDRFEVVRREFQSGIFKNGGLDHRSHYFTGNFLPGTSHPVLFNIAQHNVFADSSNVRREGYHLVPRERIDHPLAREIVLFRNPWMMRTSDDEMKREKKLQGWALDYLFILVDGKISSSFLANVKLSEGSEFKSGDGRTYIDRLGEDLWQRQAYTAIPLGRERLKDLGNDVHGEITFTKGLIHFTPPRFFRVNYKDGNYEVEEITDKFKVGNDSKISF
jgi:hypothetical protein